MLTHSVTRREFSRLALGAGLSAVAERAFAQQKEPLPQSQSAPPASRSGPYHFDGTISREVLDNYLSRAISMEGLLNGRGDLADNIRMLKSIGAKFIGRSLCLWGGEANLLRNLERAQQQVPKVHAADPEMILQACVFEIVTSQVEQVPVPDWAFVALGRPVEKRNFRYADMLYPDGRRHNQWGRNASVPDVSRPETKLWFYFLAASFIDLGIEAIHFGQAEIMNGNDPELEHWSQVLTLVRAARGQARPPAHGALRCPRPARRPGARRAAAAGFPLVPAADHGGPRPAAGGDPEGRLLRRHLRPEQGRADLQRLEVRAPALPGGDRQLGRQPAAGAGEGRAASGSGVTTRSPGSRTRANNIATTGCDYAWDWVRKTDPNGHLQMPGSRTLRSPRDGKRWYYANTPSPAVPDGLGDEETIRAIWAADSGRS